MNLNPDIFRKVDEFAPYGIWKEQVNPFPAAARSLLKTPLLSAADKYRFGAILMKILKLDAATIPHMSLRDWMEEHVRILKA